VGLGEIEPDPSRARSSGPLMPFGLPCALISIKLMVIFFDWVISVSGNFVNGHSVTVSAIHINGE
jgi:hypothetical protein